jgi:hypothetical protein
LSATIVRERPLPALSCVAVASCSPHDTGPRKKDERSLAWLRHTSRMHTTTDTLHHRNARAAWHGRAGRASGLAWVVLLLPLAKTRAHPLSYTPRRLHSPREQMDQASPRPRQGRACLGPSCLSAAASEDVDVGQANYSLIPFLKRAMLYVDVAPG